MLVSTTILKFATGSSPGSTGSASSPSSSGNLGGNSLNNNLLSWDCDKYSPVKLESPDTNLDDLLLDQSSSSDFAELKPLSFDEFGAVTVLTGAADPVLSAHNNNFILSSKSLNGDSPSTSLQFSSSSSCSQSDVTSSGSPNSPSGSSMVAKIEALDFSKNDLDDLASIVGISIDADSTVPNGGSGDCSDIADLDWIDTIKPLNCELSLESLISTAHPTMTGNLIIQRNNPLLSSPVLGQPYLQMVPLGSTLQSLLQSTTSSATGPKLQQRLVTTNPPPPPYSILQNRLQQGQTASTALVGHIIKVDSTYDILKSEDSNGLTNATYLTTFTTADTVPHSTQTPANQVSTSDQGLQRRLNELGGLAKIKKKNSGSSAGSGSAGVRPKLVTTGSSSSSVDQKKLMHHCQICNRGFLNKSNIKVHMRTHTGEKPFKCEHCSKAFRQKAHLLKHMSIHKRIARD